MSFGQNLQVFNPQRFKEVEKEIVKTKKKLEESKKYCLIKKKKVRLEEESQNTRLLKVQQKERGVDNDYKDRKKKMEDTQDQLAQEAQQFNDDQKRMNQELESKKESVVMFNDKKKKQEDDRRNKELKATQEKEIEKATALAEQEKLKRDVAQLEQKRNSYLEYEELFKTALMMMKGDFQTEQNDYENEIKQLIDRYNTLKSKEVEFKKNRDKKEQEKDKIIQEIADTKVQNDNQAYKFTIDYNKLKQQVQKINEDYHQKQTEIEGKLSQNNAQQAEYAQIIMSIKNLYSTIKIKDEIIKYPQLKENEIVIPEDPIINNQVIEDKLNMIQEQIGLLQQVKSDFLKYCKERNISSTFLNDI